MMAECVQCGAARPGASFLCSTCTARFQGRIKSMPGRILTLESMATVRQSQQGDGGGGNSYKSVVPLNVDAISAAYDMKAFLVGLAKSLPGAPVTKGYAAAAEAVAVRIGEITGRPVVDRLYRRCEKLMARADRITDGEDDRDRVFLGWCDGCSRPLYSSLDHTYHDCPGCGRTHDVRTKRQAIEQVAEQDYADEWLTPRQVELATFGRISADRVRQWKHRGKIQADESGLVLFGDCLSLGAA